MSDPSHADPTSAKSRFRRLPEPIRLAQTTTSQETRPVFVASGIFPVGLMAAMGGADGGGCDGD